jgi:hypothetical protein
MNNGGGDRLVFLEQTAGTNRSVAAANGDRIAEWNTRHTNNPKRRQFDRE